MWRRLCLLWAAVAAVLPTIPTGAAWEEVFSGGKVWIPKESQSCQVLPGQKDGQLEVVCEGLKSLSEAGNLVAVKQQPSITKLTVTYSNLTRIALDDLQAFPALTTLSLNNSVMSDWASPSVTGLPKVTSLVLDHCWDNESMENENGRPSAPTFTLTVEQLNMLPDLRELYIAESNLYRLDSFRPPPHIHLTVEGGGIECKAESLWVMDWVMSGKADISNSTQCFVRSSTFFFNMKYSFNKKVFLITMGYWKDMERDCPEICNCRLNGIKENDLPIIYVNCSGVGLSQIPEYVPALIQSIDLENNTITNFTRVFTHPLYRNVDKINLAYNKITNMDGRLFYQFAHNRSVDLCIDLSHNQLSKFPVREVQRVYDEAMERGTQHLPIFMLGYNPWDCDDCSFLPAFQKIVYHIKYNNNLKPYLDIRCKEGARGDLGMQQVVKLDVVSLCQPDPPLMSPMDVIVICLAVLLILFLLNFLHNFFQYRRHGKLPWIITKLPSC